jgi:hypothetical protein
MANVDNCCTSTTSLCDLCILGPAATGFSSVCGAVESFVEVASEASMLRCRMHESKGMCSPRRSFRPPTTDSFDRASPLYRTPSFVRRQSTAKHGNYSSEFCVVKKHPYFASKQGFRSLKNRYTERPEDSSPDIDYRVVRTLARAAWL